MRASGQALLSRQVSYIILLSAQPAVQPVGSIAKCESLASPEAYTGDADDAILPAARAERAPHPLPARRSPSAGGRDGRAARPAPLDRLPRARAQPRRARALAPPLSLPRARLLRGLLPAHRPGPRPRAPPPAGQAAP